MLHRFHDRFGTAGVVIGVIALIVALGGTALAAGGLTSQQEKQVKKIAKKFAGKPGAPGANGTNGGNGTPGAKGDAGTPGAPGGAGVPGQSVTGTPIAAGGACGASVTGVKYTLGATSTNICNGQTGFTETLPSGKTETGNWNAIGTVSKNLPLPYPISFSIPLAAPSGKVVYLNLEETEESIATPVEGCELEIGNLAAIPVAPPDTLCVFTRLEESGQVKFIGESFVNKGDSPAGTFAWVEALQEPKELGNPNLRLSGTWAVTAP